MSLSEISIKRPTVAIVILIVTLLTGLYFGNQLKYELIPDISTPVIITTTVYPGAGPEDIEKSVTIPIEDALATIEGIDEIVSSSKEGVSLVKLMMKYEVDSDIALQDAKAKIDQVIKDLPIGIRPPSVSKSDLSALPIITMGVTSDLPDADFYDQIEYEIQPALSQIPGVANVSILGGSEREIKVNVDHEKLKSFELNINRVVNMIGASNAEFPAGKIENRSSQTSIRLAGKFSNLNDIRESTIGYDKNGLPIKLKQVADVYESSKTPETIARINGSNAIALEISKQKEANAVDVSNMVKEKISELENKYAQFNVKFTLSNDTSVFIMNSARSVGKDLIMAIILVSLIMLFFLQSLRNSLFVLVTIPTSLVATFTVMYLLDFSLDLISLTSLSLVVGSVVDDAIVIIENIHRHMEMGKNKMKATLDSMREVGLTLVSTTAVLVAVFLPIAFVSGITGQILREYAITIVAAMLFSLLFTFTLVPLLTSRFAKIEVLKDNRIGRLLTNFENYLSKIAKGITGLLHWCLNHKIVTTLIVLIMLCGSIYLVPAGYIGASFMDAGDRGNVILRLEFPRDITIKQNAQLTSQAENILLNQREVERVYKTIGKRTGGVLSSGGGTNYYTEMNVTLVPIHQREYKANILAKILKLKLEEELTGVIVSSANVNIMGNEDIPLQIYVKGDNVDSVYKASEYVTDVLGSIDGTTEIETSLNMGNPEYQIIVDRQKLAHYGLTIKDVAGTIQTSFEGNTDNQYRVGNKEYDINVRFDEFNRNNKTDLESIVFYTNKGSVYLNQFAEIVLGNGPSVLERLNRSTSANIKCQLIGTSQGVVQNQFESYLKDNPLPGGTEFAYSSKTKMMNDSFASLGVAFLAAIIFMYLIMVLLYNNWIHPFVVLFTVPLAIIGALFALALARQNLSLFSLLGIIMLAGLVAKNAILVIDFANELLADGKKLIDAVTEAVQLRFRAILMTNISMVIGLIPLAISKGAGAEWKNGIGWVLIGGLMLSMILSMVIVPMVYYAFERMRVKVKAKA